VVDLCTPPARLVRTRHLIVDAPTLRVTTKGPNFELEVGSNTSTLSLRIVSAEYLYYTSTIDALGPAANSIHPSIHLRPLIRGRVAVAAD